MKNIIKFVYFIFIGLSFLIIKDIKIDASPDTLLLKNDPNYIYSKEIDNRYNQEPIMFFSISTNGSFLKKDNLSKVDILTKKLESIPNIEKVISLTNIPILEASSKSILEIKNPDNLLSKNIDFKKAKEELLNNNIYIDNIINKDFSSINFIITVNNNVKETIYQIRELIKVEKNNWKEVQFGGLQVIKEDIIHYVKNDLLYLGGFSLLFFLIFIWYVFKNKDYILYIVINLISIVSFSTLSIVLLDYKISVVSSNFIAILMILSLSLSIHLIIRYNENYNLEKNRVINTIKDLFKPSLLVVLTTMIGFISLTFSNIKPIIDFGQMMVISLFISLFLSFFNFILFMKNKSSKKIIFTSFIPKKLFIFQEKKTKTLLLLVVLSIFISIIGIYKISVENSFVNYFKQNSEIFKSLTFLDKNFGGTTSLDIIVKLKDIKPNILVEDKNNTENIEDDFLNFNSDIDSFEEEFNDTKPSYFNLEFSQISILDGIQKILNDNTYIGKVQSLPMVFDMVRYYKKNDLITPYELDILVDKVSEDIKETLVYPYFNKDKNEFRFLIRIYDSNNELKRNIFLKNIENEIIEKYGKDLEYVNITGTMVLYNNLLQSLIDAQINSFLFVLICMFFLFLIMLKTLKQTLILIFVNSISVLFILGIIGLTGTSLDLMTITIISIALGISVDDSIHYVFRFNKEKKHKSYNTQKNIGIAMLLTTLVVIIGFSVMIMSDFIPNIYFGILISISMLIALLLNLTLLPKLLEINYKESLKN